MFPPLATPVHYACTWHVHWQSKACNFMHKCWQWSVSPKEALLWQIFFGRLLTLTKDVQKAKIKSAKTRA